MTRQDRVGIARRLSRYTAVLLTLALLGGRQLFVVLRSWPAQHTAAVLNHAVQRAARQRSHFSQQRGSPKANTFPARSAMTALM